PLAAEVLAHLEAVHLGQPHVEDDEVERIGETVQGLAAVPSELGRIALALEVEDEPLRDRLLVLHDEDARGGGIAHASVPRGTAGSSTTKRLPGLPSCENASTVPRISLTSPETIERPRPV